MRYILMDVQLLLIGDGKGIDRFGYALRSIHTEYQRHRLSDFRIDFETDTWYLGKWV